MNRPSLLNPVIEAYKKDVDLTLIRENLRLTPDQRVRKFVSFMRLIDELRQAGRKMRQASRDAGSE